MFVARWLGLETHRAKFFLELLSCNGAHGALLVIISLQGRLQFRKTFFHRNSRSVDAKIRLSIERLPGLEYAPQVFHGSGVPRHGAKVALFPHTGHVLLWPCLDPHRVAVREKTI